jgi:hypothetical protein
MRKLRTTSSADVDIAESGVWFEQQQLGMGSDFLDAVDNTLAEISRRPQSCPTLIFPTRKLKVQLRWLAVNRFPRLVIFQVTTNEVVIHAVLHSHRDLESILLSRIGAS